MRKIYLASSWKNADKVRWLANKLKENNHKVFDFTDGNSRQHGMDTYVFNARKLWGDSVDRINHIEFLRHPETQRAFRSDKAGIDWCNTLILILPAGLSSHLEAGYARGKGKEIFLYGNLPLGQYDTMYGFATGIFLENELDKLLEFLLYSPVESYLDFYPYE